MAHTMPSPPPIFQSPDYNGHGSCLLLRSVAPSVSLESSFFSNIVRRSFTIEFWLLAQSMPDPQSNQAFPILAMVERETSQPLLPHTFGQSDLRDTGPLLITRATGIDYSFTSLARVNVALNLSHPNSFVQITALTRLGISNWPSTFSLWIYPIDRLGGTILQLSQSISTRWCLAILRLSSSGHILMQSSDESSDILFGPVLDLFTWTHVAVTSSSSSHGRRLYINGTQYGRSADAGSGVSMTVTLGSALNRDGGGRCGDERGHYSGLVDEFQVYARELSPSELYASVNSIFIVNAHFLILFVPTTRMRSANVRSD